VPISADLVTASDWSFSVSATANLIQKLSDYPHKLGDIAARIGQGIRTSANEIYVLNEQSRGEKEVVTALAPNGQTVKMAAEVCSRFLQGRGIKRYAVAQSGKVVILPYSFRSYADGRSVHFEWVLAP